MSTSASNLVSLLSRLDRAQNQFLKLFRAFRRKKDDPSDTVFQAAVDAANEGIKRALREVCDVAREGSREGILETDDYAKLMDRASELEALVITGTVREEYLWEFVPPTCGNDVTDESMGSAGLGGGHAAMLLGMLEDMPAPDRAGIPAHVADVLLSAAGANAEPYDPSSRPSTHTTPLARFSQGRPLLPSAVSPELRAFAEARCEIDYNDAAHPAQLVATDTVLAAMGRTSGAHPTSTLRIHSLRETPKKGGVTPYVPVPVRLSSLATHIEVDDRRNIVYVGSDTELHSFSWEFDEDRPENSWEYGKVTPRNRFKCAGYSGAFMLMQDGTRLVRSEPGGLRIWDTTQLPDELAEPQQIVKALALAGIAKCTLHPSNEQELIVTYQDKYGAGRISLETERLVGRYVGHGAAIKDIRTSRDDPHSFITTADDGIVRLYDVRTPTPVLAILHRDEVLHTALYEHIGGQPFVILGGVKSEQVKVWDVRAKLPLYELSTGNNQVHTLAWDAPRQTLYAGTRCAHLDHNGFRIDYRPAVFPEFGDTIKRGWPKHAYHSEQAFGHPLDSCGARLYGYRFKENADVSILPKYQKYFTDSG